jgi:hypothetical protein
MIVQLKKLENVSHLDFVSLLPPNVTVEGREVPKEGLSPSKYDCVRNQNTRARAACVRVGFPEMEHQPFRVD